MPTDLTFGPDGSVYISDGYGNSRVVRLTSDGAYVSEWGSHGSSQREFDTPHSIAAAPDGRVFVCDRTNGRIQVFDPDGAFADEWRPSVGQPQAITISPTGECWLANAIDSNTGRISRLDLDTWAVLGTMESPGHMLEMSAWGELFVAALSGNISDSHQRRSCELSQALTRRRGRLGVSPGVRLVDVREYARQASPRRRMPS